MNGFQGAPSGAIGRYSGYKVGTGSGPRPSQPKQDTSVWGSVGGQFGQYLQPGSLNVTAPDKPMAGTLERAARAREFQMSNAASQTAQAVAGGAYGDTRGALAGGAQMGNQAGMQASQAGDALVEADLARQLAAAQGNQSTLLGQGRLAMDASFGQQGLNQNAQTLAYQNAMRALALSLAKNTPVNGNFSPNPQVLLSALGAFV